MHSSSQFSSLLALSLVLFVVLACRTGGSDTSAVPEDTAAIPVPEDKKDYIGDWKGQFQNGSMTLSISPDGTVNYERREVTTGTFSKTNTKYFSGGKIHKFDGNDFEVRALSESTTFKVEKPPYRDGQMWKMVVDGVELSRENSDDDAPASDNSNEVTVEIAEMRKDDGNGKMSIEVTNTFSQTDKAIHCYVQWRNPKAGTRVKFGWTAPGKKTEFSDHLTESDKENAFSQSLEMGKGQPLPKGTYKVEIYVNDKLERTLHFEIT